MGNGYHHPRDLVLPPLLQRPPRQLAGRCLVIYLLLGSLWIVVSDRLVLSLTSPWGLSNHLQTLKGLFYVLTTGIALYLLVYQGVTAIRRTQISLQTSNADLQRARQQIQQQLDDLLAVQITYEQSAERYKSLLLATAQVVWVAQPDGSMVEITPSWSDLTGQSQVQALGGGWVQAIHPEDVERVSQAWQQAISTGGFYEVEYRLLTADQKERYLYVRSAPVRSPTGEILEWVGTCTDITEQRRAEQALRQSEEQRRLALDLTNVGCWDWDPISNSVTWNDSHFRVLGLQPGESQQPKYQLWRDRMHPDDIDQVEQVLSHALQNGTKYETEYRVVYPDGSLHWLKGMGQAIYDSSRTPVRMIGVLLDISDQKQTEFALRDSQERFRTFMDNSPVCAWITATDGRMVYTNQTYLRMVQLPTQDLVDRYVEELFPADIAQQYLANTRQVAAQGEVMETIELAPRVDGSLAELLVYKFPLPTSSGPVLVGGWALDITDRRRAEAEIRQLNANLEQLVAQRTSELESLINAMPDYIFAVERDTMRMIFCNDVFAQGVGFDDRQQIQGKTIFECFPPEQSQYFLQQNLEVFDSDTSLHLRESIFLKGKTRHFETFKIPLKRQGSEAYALLGISRDYTELIETQYALSARTTQLEASNRELDSFSYSVSHDLRAPLRHIHGFVVALSNQLDQRGLLTEAPIRHYLEVIQNSSQKMGLLIDGLLTLSRVGRKPLNDGCTDLNQTVQAAIAQIPELGSDRDLPGTDSSQRQIDLAISPLPTVKGDPTLLQQVFVNLLDNAVKFSRGRCPAEIVVGSLNDGTVFIRDNGVGFQMEYASQLFGAFQRLHSQTEFEGTGIGLAIVHRIVQRHGGTIWAESEPDRGTTFYFKLPTLNQE